MLNLDHANEQVTAAHPPSASQAGGVQLGFARENDLLPLFPMRGKVHASCGA
jgi:hypothetical protein